MQGKVVVVLLLLHVSVTYSFNAQYAHGASLVRNEITSVKISIP